MYKFFPILLFALFLFSCSSTTNYNLDYNVLITAVPDQSKFGNYTSYESEIVGYNIETKKYVRFTNDNFEDDNPSCSPSGDKILFTSKRPITGYFSGPAPKKIFIFEVSTKDIKKIKSKALDKIINEGFIDYHNPVWSPISNEIAFGMRYLDSSKLVVYDLDTDELTLTVKVPEVYKIAWSSDGKFIGYQGIHTTDLSANEISMTFELGFIDVKNQKKIVVEQTDRLSWGLIGGVKGNNNFMIYNIDSAKAPMKIYEYNVIANDKKYLATTMERWPEECGATSDEILFIKTAENYSQDIWLMNIKTKSFKQITFDGKSKIDIKYFNK